MMRMPWPAAVAGVAVAALGAAGLIRAAVPVSANAGPGASASSSLVISGAYVRQPVPPDNAAAAYFTIDNTTGGDDRLLTVVSGAGATTMLHSSGMSMNMAGAVIPAHGRLVLSTGQGHVMIEHLFRRLRAGQSVNFELTFAHAGTMTVLAPVIAFGTRVPTSAPTGGSGP